MVTASYSPSQQAYRAPGVTECCRARAPGHPPHHGRLPGLLSQLSRWYWRCEHVNTSAPGEHSRKHSWYGCGCDNGGWVGEPGWTCHSPRWRWIRVTRWRGTVSSSGIVSSMKLYPILHACPLLLFLLTSPFIFSLPSPLLPSSVLPSSPPLPLQTHKHMYVCIHSLSLPLLFILLLLTLPHPHMHSISSTWLTACWYLSKSWVVPEPRPGEDGSCWANVQTEERDGQTRGEDGVLWRACTATDRGHSEKVKVRGRLSQYVPRWDCSFKVSSCVSQLVMFTFVLEQDKTGKVRRELIGSQDKSRQSQTCTKLVISTTTYLPCQYLVLTNQSTTIQLTHVFAIPYVLSRLVLLVSSRLTLPDLSRWRQSLENEASGMSVYYPSLCSLSQLQDNSELYNERAVWSPGPTLLRCTQGTALQEGWYHGDRVLWQTLPLHPHHEHWTLTGDEQKDAVRVRRHSAEEHHTKSMCTV